MGSTSKRDPVRLGSLRIRCLDCEDCPECDGDEYVKCDLCTSETCGSCECDGTRRLRCTACKGTGIGDPCGECEDRESEIQHEATRFRDRDIGRGIEGPDRVYVECARRYLEEDYLIP
jgi:hypothetical protein